MTRPRLLLVDDHEVFTAALTSLLRERYEVVGAVSSLEGARSAVEALAPDLVLLDISLGKVSGLEVASALLKLPACPPLLALSMHEEPELAAEFLRRGGAGYLLKRSSAEELTAGIEAALAGDPAVAASLQLLESGHRVGGLTERQREVLALLAAGHSMRAIASELGISPKTVEYHKYTMMAALGLRTTADLVAHALQHGLRVAGLVPPKQAGSESS